VTLRRLAPRPCRSCGGEVVLRLDPRGPFAGLRCADCGHGDDLRPGALARDALEETLRGQGRVRERGNTIRPVVLVWLPPADGWSDTAVMIRERLATDDPDVMLVTEPYPGSADDPRTGPLALADFSLLAAPDEAAARAATGLLGTAVPGARALIFATGLDERQKTELAHPRLRCVDAAETEPGGLFDALSGAIAWIRRAAFHVSAGAPPLTADAFEPAGHRTAEILVGTDPLTLAALLLASRPGCPGWKRLTREFGGAAHLEGRFESLSRAEAVRVRDDRVALTDKGRAALSRVLTPAAGEADPPALALARLIDEARAGSRESLSRLLRLGSEEVQRIAHHRIGPALRAKFETVDITQSVMGELLAGLDGFEFRGEAAWRGYLRRLVENKIRAKADYYGAARRDYRREVALPDEEGRRGPRPPDTLMRVEELGRLEEAMAAMPTDEREVILLRVFEGLSHREVARRMGRPSEGSVHKLYGRALARLTKLIGRRA